MKVVQNNYTWANNFNVLFVDQPVGTGLSYADTSSGSPFVTSLDGTNSYTKMLPMTSIMHLRNYTVVKDALELDTLTSPLQIH